MGCLYGTQSSTRTYELPLVARKSAQRCSLVTQCRSQLELKDACLGCWSVRRFQASSSPLALFDTDNVRVPDCARNERHYSAAVLELQIRLNAVLVSAEAKWAVGQPSINEMRERTCLNDHLADPIRSTSVGGRYIDSSLSCICLLIALVFHCTPSCDCLHQLKPVELTVRAQIRGSFRPGSSKHGARKYV